jgi:cellulose synthase/poly-beta-1,6-N-acetylglucosamine synthase-like glycosyltransferase
LLSKKFLIKFLLICLFLRLNFQIIKKKTYNYSINVAAKKAKNFLSICIKGSLISKSPIKLNNEPKISVVVPAYNVEKYIKPAIRSIQNQNIIDIDIVIVNDCSSDNTSIIIEQIKKEDKRIRLINNKKNLGLLYTRCIGTLAAKGKYIFPLDGDDIILDKNIIKNINNL